MARPYTYETVESSPKPSARIRDIATPLQVTPETLSDDELMAPMAMT